MVQYFGQLENAFQRMKIINGCSDTEVSFHFDADGNGTLDTAWPDGYYYNPSATRNECFVFHPDGGGLNYRDPPLEYLIDAADYLQSGYGMYDFTGGLNYDGIGSTCFGGSSDCTDLSVTLKGVTEEFCRAFNKKVFNDDTIPEHETWAWNPSYGDATSFFRGQYRGWSATPTLAHPAVSFLSGNPMGCFKVFTSSPAQYVIYSVLLAR